MHSVTQQRHLPLSAEALFDLVLDIERYPEFVPGYHQARIVARQPQQLKVFQELGLAGVHFHFHTTTEFNRPERIRIHTREAPFRTMQIDWRFQALAEDQCAVSFAMQYALRLGIPLPGAGWVFKRMATATVDAFVQRAPAQARENEAMS